MLHPEHVARGTYADVKMNPGPREIYALLEQAESETFPVPEFEPFYMDLSFRTRHGAALSVGVYQGERLAACAVCTAMTEHARGDCGGCLRSRPSPARLRPNGG